MCVNFTSQHCFFNQRQFKQLNGRLITAVCDLISNSDFKHVLHCFGLYFICYHVEFDISKIYGYCGWLLPQVGAMLD